MAINSPNTINAPRAIYVDQLPDGTTYIGLAKPGSLSSAAVWQIRKLVISGTQTLIQWGSGNEKFDKIWDSRGGYVYS